MCCIQKVYLLNLEVISLGCKMQPYAQKREGDLKMGMFDTIQDRLFCPFCGKLQEKDSFQTKDMSSMGTTWTIEEIKKYKTRKLVDDTRIYSNCKFCKNWIELTIKGEQKV